MCKRKQTILIVHNYYKLPGGEDTVVANERRMLEEHGHKVVLYTRNNLELDNLTNRQKILLPVSVVYNYKTYREVKKLIREESVDVVHVHNTLNLISPSVYYAAFFCKIPVVQTVHNFRLLCPGATFYRNGDICEDCLKKGLGCAVKHKCYRSNRLQTLACVVSIRIHRLLGTYGRLSYICLTEFNKEKLLNLKQVKEEQVFIKPNAVSGPENLIPAKERERQFLYVGRLEKIKGVDILLKAWKILGEDAPELVLCGAGPMEAWCREYIAEHQLMKVKLLGFVPNDKVRQMIAKAKALILPTQVYEGFPMTIAEAYSNKTPVIGSDLGNTGSLIEENVSGWKFSYQSPESLAEAVRKADESSVEFPERIRQKYSLEENYKILEEIYQKCAAQENML